MLRPFLYLNRSYSFAARTRAESLLTRLEGSAAEMSDVEFQIAVHRIAALSDNAHSSVREGGFARNFGSVPVRGSFFADGYHVLRAGPGHRDLLGARVTAVDGRDLETVLGAVRDLVGGPDVYFRTFQADLLFTVPALLHALGMAERPDRLTLDLTLSDGGEVRRTLQAVGAEGAELEKGWVNRIPSAAREESEWSGLMSDEGVPPVLKDWSRRRALAWIEEGAVPYLLLRGIRDEEGQTVGEFLSNAASEISARRPAVVVVDLRYSYGGDYTATLDFFSALPDLLSDPGTIYLLTGNATFSAGLLVAAYVKHVGGERTVIVGEPVGDRGRFWAESIHYRLPNCGLRMNYSLYLHDASGGCDDPSVCFPHPTSAEVAVGALAPDVLVPLDFAAYAAGRDPVLERVTALVAGGGSGR
jgi:hypothetical protein